MKTALKVALRMSEVRQRLNKIAGLEGDAMTDEVRSEADALHTEYTDLEVRSRAALIGESTETVTEGAPADPARIELEQRAMLSGIVSGIVSGTGATGAERELQHELGLPADSVPLSLIQTEHRTSGQTSAPGDTGASQQPIIDAVFPMAAATFLGVDQPTVAVGDATFTVVSTNLSPGTPGGGADQDHSAGAFTATVVSPKRIQGSFFIRREDRARLAGMEEALRRNLNMAMSDRFDSEIIGANGFLKADALDGVPSGDAGAAGTFANYRSFVYDAVDGTYASMASDIMVLLGAKAYQHAASVYRSNNADDSALDSIMRVSGGVRVSAHIPAPATNDQSLLVCRNKANRHAVAPIWQGMQLIVDEVTQAKQGEIVFTSVMLWGGLNVVRKAGFVHRKVQVA